MRTTVLPGTTLTVSRFTFGTGSLHTVGRAGARRRLLLTAADSGFTHFDTSPYYGFGIAERDLASVLKAHPAATLTTKVGLLPPGGAEQPDWLVILRKLLGKRLGVLSKPIVDYSIESARRSLEGSLRRTGRERIDVYAIHDPPLPLIDTEEWGDWMASSIAEGKIRYAGMATDSEKLRPFVESGRVVGQVMQLRDSLCRREADILVTSGMQLQFTYGYVSAGMRDDPTLPADQILCQALRRNARGSIVVSSTKANRIAQYSQISSEEPM